MQIIIVLLLVLNHVFNSLKYKNFLKEIQYTVDYHCFYYENLQLPVLQRIKFTKTFFIKHCNILWKNILLRSCIRCLVNYAVKKVNKYLLKKESYPGSILTKSWTLNLPLLFEPCFVRSGFLKTLKGLWGLEHSAKSNSLSLSCISSRLILCFSCYLFKGS